MLTAVTGFLDFSLFIFILLSSSVLVLSFDLTSDGFTVSFVYSGATFGGTVETFSFLFSTFGANVSFVYSGATFGGTVETFAFTGSTFAFVGSTLTEFLLIDSANCAL